MLLLVEKGLDREFAYKIVQENSMKTWDEDSDFRELIRTDTRVTGILKDTEIEELFNYGNYTKYVNAIYEKAGL
jgi:adenylosuccinate lyase